MIRFPTGLPTVSPQIFSTLRSIVIWFHGTSIIQWPLLKDQGGRSGFLSRTLRQISETIIILFLNVRHETSHYQDIHSVTT